MNNPCTTPFRKGKSEIGDETTFSAPYTPKKGAFPQTFPKRKADHYSSKPQDYITKPTNFLHRFHDLYTSPSHSSSDKEEKVFSSFEKWLIYNESSVEKNDFGENCGKGEWVKVASKEQAMPRPDRATRRATKHKSPLGEETPFLCEKNYLGRKNRISFRTWQKTFYFCTLKYHALIAPQCASAHLSDPICHTSSLRFRAPPCCFSLPAL